MRKFSVAVLLLLTGALAPVSAQAPAPSPETVTAPPARTTAQRAAPRVVLLATGGTIANRSGGRLTADELIASVPGLDAVASAEAEQFANVASAQLPLPRWLDLSRRITSLLRDDPALAGIVVTSGTDTLEELAYFLHLTVRDRRPVVVTGSMRTPDHVGYDGAANLLAAFRVAAAPGAAGRGVLVVLDDEINGAREVTKTDARRLHTFMARGVGRLGVVDADRVVFERTAAGRHTAASEFDIARLTSLPRVDVLLTYQGATGDLIRAAIDFGARGLVIATAGAGAISGTQSEGLAYARNKGIPVVITTRAGGGRITPDASRRIAGSDLSPIKARVLLMLALAVSVDDAQLQRIFDEY